MKKIIFIICITSSIFSQELPTYQAIITDIQGSVLVKRAKKSDYTKALWGLQLFAGDQLKTLKNSFVSLLFSNNNLIRLGANSLMEINPKQQDISSEILSSLKLSDKLPGNVPLFSFRKKENGEIGALAGLRSEGTHDIILLSPRNSKISTLAPEFKWQSYTQYENYKITLFDETGKIWTRDINKSSYELSKADVKLTYDKSYFWYVDGKNLFESKRSESIGFNIPNEEEFNKIIKESESILKLFTDHPDSNTYNYVLGNYYQEKGYYLDAIESFQLISNMNKEAPLPHQILGSLYQKIGLKDLAISELQKAVELNKENE